MMALFMVSGALVLIAAAMWYRHRKFRVRIQQITAVLSEIEGGNDRRKLLADPGEETAELCFRINHIVEQYLERITLLERKEKAHKQLLTGLSHDLRTPLSSLIGYLEAVDEGYIEDERKPEYISAAKQKAHDLKRLTDLLFDWFKLDAQEMSFCFETIDLSELTRIVVADFIPMLEKSGMEYRVIIPEGEIFCHLDAQAYARMLGNLIQNAIVHSGGSIVTISVQEDKERAVVSVCDDGLGIREQDLPYLFDRLYKCDPSRTAKSSGLGLSITKALARAHGGSAEVTSMQGQGCTFTLHLPRASTGRQDC